MALIGENQVRNMYVPLSYSGVANIAALKAAAIGDSAVLKSDGTAVAAGAEFKFFVKNWKGDITASDYIDPARVTYGSSTKFSPRVEKVYTIDNIEALANELYAVRITIQGYGSLSAEDEYIKEAFYKSKTGDDAEDIVDGLVKSLARNMSREQPASNDTFTYTLADSTTVELKDNLYFDFAKAGTGATASLTIIAKADYLEQYYITGRKTRLDMLWTADVNFPGDGDATLTTVGSLGKGTGYEVRNAEEYLLGNRQDTFRGAGYPHNFEEHYDSVLTGEYHAINLEYYDEGRDDARKSKKQITIVIVDAGVDNAGTTEYNVVNAIIADLNTAIAGANGVVIADIPTNPTV